jgi:hypothetical protein
MRFRKQMTAGILAAFLALAGVACEGGTATTDDGFGDPGTTTDDGLGGTTDDGLGGTTDDGLGGGMDDDTTAP